MHPRLPKDALGSLFWSTSLVNSRTYVQGTRGKRALHSFTRAGSCAWLHHILYSASMVGVGGAPPTTYGQGYPSMGPIAP